MDLRELPKQDKRVETGVVRFGDDWPGVFIRGDDSFHFAMMLRSGIEQLEKAERRDLLTIINLKNLQELLAACDMRELRKVDVTSGQVPPDLLDRALAFATERHSGQFRKYHAGVPAIAHCIRVAVEVAKRQLPPVAVAAAYLHDVLEDTQTTEQELRERFGDEVTQLVVELTNTTKGLPDPRPKIKKMDRERLAKCSPLARQVKLLDRIDNLTDLYNACDSPVFAVNYAFESAALADAIGQEFPLLVSAITILRNQILKKHLPLKIPKEQHDNTGAL